MTGQVPHQDFISGLHKGNFQAVREMYSLYYGDLYQFCRELVKEEQEAGTIVTETFIKLLQNRERFDNLQNMKAFLYITTRNTCLNYLKYRKNNEPVQARPGYRIEPVTDVDGAGNELVTAVSAEIDQLPETTRTIFQRLYCNSEFVADVADQLGLSAQVVLQYKADALYLLQQALAKKGSSFNLPLIYYLGIVCPGQRLATAS